MAFQDLQTPNSQAWSDSEYNYVTRGKGMDTIVDITSFESNVALDSNNLSLRLFPGGILVASGVITVSAVFSINDKILTLPMTLHEDKTFSVVKVDASEDPTGVVQFFVDKTGAVFTLTVLSTGEFFKLSGAEFRPNIKP